MEQINIDEFFKKWCKETKRNGGILIGSSIKDLLIAFDKEITLDKGMDNHEKDKSR